MIRYRAGYDGQLVDGVEFQLPANLHPKDDIETEFLDLYRNGRLQIRAAYAWDFASVPFTRWISNRIAGRKSKVPSLVHDALCQLHRNFDLGDDFRENADIYFYHLLLVRNFWRIRAWLWFRAVRLGARIHKQKPKSIYSAP